MTLRVAILGNYALQFLKKAIAKQAKQNGLDIEIYLADFDQVDLEILDESSELYAFNPDYVLIHESAIALKQKFYEYSDSDRPQFAQNHVQRLNMLFNTIGQRLSKAVILYPNLELVYDNVFGNYYAKVSTSWDYQLNKLNWLITETVENCSNVLMLDINNLLKEKITKDWTLYVNADLHFNLEATTEIASEIIRMIKVAQGKFMKCIILDLDNTTWGGIIGDDGLDKIEIGSLGIGKAFSKLQTWVKELKNRGIIVAVCSKNEEAIAKEPFEKHPEMVLKLSDIAVFVANWENKADNIRFIQQVLNIGFDSMVFVDDNPMERNLVKTELPEITVPEMPEDPANYLSYLIGLNLFETVSFSSTDKERTNQYKEEAERQLLAQKITNIDEYLASLNMKGTIEPFKEIDFARIAQLTQRSNQFNLRTIRYSEHEIAQLASSKSHKTYAIKLTDKFGDYGLISVVILAKQGDNSWFVDTWLMSCRVLKRGVEQFIMNHVVSELNNSNTIKGEYLETSKNALVKNLLPDLSFKHTTGNEFELKTTNFTPLKTSILHG